MQYWFVEVTRTKYRDGMRLSTNKKNVQYDQRHRAVNSFAALVSNCKRDSMTEVRMYEEDKEPSGLFKDAIYASEKNGIVTIVAIKLWTRVYNDALKETLKKFPYPILRDAYKALGINCGAEKTGNVINQSVVDEED